jgi:hypothetical protein
MHTTENLPAAFVAAMTAVLDLDLTLLRELDAEDDAETHELTLHYLAEACRLAGIDADELNDADNGTGRWAVIDAIKTAAGIGVDGPGFPEFVA